MPSLQDLATNLANYQYYSGIGTFNANKLPFGRDTPGGGDSGQPFVIRKIDQRWSPSNMTDSLTPFGAITTVTRTVKDVERVSKFMFNSTMGPMFLIKQTGLQAMNPNIDQLEVGQSDKKLISTQIYNPLGLNTLAEVAVVGAGIHFKKHGLLPGVSDTTKYENYILKNDRENNNRLNSLSVYLSNNLKDYRDYVLKYKGGPESFFGIGSTTINRYGRLLATDYLEERSATNNGFSYIPYAQYQSLNSQKEIQIDLNTGRDGNTGAENSNVFKFGQYSDFREYKNKLNKAQFADKYTTLATSKYDKLNLETRIGVAKVRKPQDRVDYTSEASTADRINAIGLYYAAGPAESKIDVNGKAVNDGTPQTSIRDIIKFRIKILDNDKRPVAKASSKEGSFGVYIVFRAYISNIRRNVVSKWDAYKYVGRGESFYAYDGFTETVTYSFVIAASSRAEMKPLYQKLNYLISSMAPDYKDNLMRGNIAELTIGDFLLYQPGIITNFDMNIDEDSNWEIALQEPDTGDTGTDTDMHELPQLIKCNMTFIPIYNFLPRKSFKAPFIGIDGMSEKEKVNKQWLKDPSNNLKESKGTVTVEPVDKSYKIGE